MELSTGFGCDRALTTQQTKSSLTEGAYQGVVQGAALLAWYPLQKLIVIQLINDNH